MLWLLISTAAAVHAAPPERVELSFDVLHNGSSVARVEHRLQHDGRVYELTETWSGKGLYALLGTARRTSRGTIAHDGLQPQEYRDERTGRRTARARFDWQAQTVTLQYKGDPRVLPLPADASDRLAFLFDFAFSPPPAAQVTFHLIDGRGKSRHVYALDGRERLTTPAGQFEAFKLVRRTDGELAEIWLAAERSYLPLRIRVTEKDGALYDQVLTKISAP
ncbi:MAG: DUF3108 domain-containing protein [Burkholderiales bacterium]